MEGAMVIKPTFFMGLLIWTCASVGGAATVPEHKATSGPLNVGPVALTGTTYASAATVTANALGSGVNGPETAQTGLTVNISKDNWWRGGKVGEIDGINVMVRQNAPGSDGSGILINVQNQGNGFLSATEFASTIVDPVRNKITHAIDVQEGVLNKKTGDFIGAVYSADTGTLGTGVLVQNSRGASWLYAFKYEKDGGVKFAVDGVGGIVGSSASIGSVALGGDSKEGSIDVGNLGNKSATPYINLNGFGKSNDVRLINDANGQLTVKTATGGTLQVNAGGVHTSGSFHINLATPAKSSSPCATGQLGADHNYVYVCVSPNTWRRSALNSF
jgi:hypothetical protein